MNLSLLASRAFFAFDLALGCIGGFGCPNCGRRPRLSRAAFVSMRRGFPIIHCLRCELLYRPTGITNRALLELYYGHLYSNAGIATSTGLANDRAELEEALRVEGKDRTALLGRFKSEFQRQPTICVLGCSWGYELSLLQDAGWRVCGIELSGPRRKKARARGFEVFPSEAELVTKILDVDVLFSSHVLEHIPRISERLNHLRSTVRPAIQVHITPCVERLGIDPSIDSVIGREHPLGITSQFWRRFATEASLDLQLDTPNVVAGACGELVAVLREIERT